jgi:type IV pilus assembly protein PilQ
MSSKAMINKKFRKTKHQCLALLTSLATSVGLVDAAVLESVDYNVLPGDQVSFTLSLDESTQEPRIFTTENPARIVLDFEGVSSAVRLKTQSVNVGATQNITAVEAGGKTRVVVGLSNMVPYATQADGASYKLVVGGSNPDKNVSGGSDVAQPVKVSSASKATPAKAENEAYSNHDIQAFDFRRGEAGSGRVMVTLRNTTVTADMRQEGGAVVVDFPDANANPDLLRRLDVTDFATPVGTIQFKGRQNGTRLVIDPIEDYTHIAYQSGNTFIVEVKPLTEEEEDIRAQAEFQYTGEKMSLNFQDIEVRAVLQLIADLTELNLVASDSVNGRITLRLNNVPWDQALDIILKTKGLDKRQNGNVLMVAPTDELAAQERQLAEATQQQEQIAQLYTEYIEINYANAAEIKALLEDEGGSSRGGGEESDGGGLLSARGTVNVDARTNTLIVRETADRLSEIRTLIRQIDIPVEQVLIESRIVVATEEFTEEFGARLGLSGTQIGTNTNYSSAGNLTSANEFINGFRQLDLTGEGFEFDPNDSLNVNLPAANPQASSIGFELWRLGDNLLLDLELSALETEGAGEVVGSPKLVTADKQEAYIEAGEEIPYPVATASGATAIAFKKAVLSLKVTPQITPDERIIMDLVVNQDTRGTNVAIGNGQFVTINTQEIATQVLVDNGETIVLGGVFTQTKNNSLDKTPLLGDLPAVGWLFKRKSKIDDKRELLIFITPKIIDQALN